MITKQLQYGMTDPQVKELQKWLNEHGFTVATSGAGSPGNETDYFGSATQAAVQKFQAAQGIVSSGSPTTTGYGRVGPQTLAKITEVSKKKEETPPLAIMQGNTLMPISPIVAPTSAPTENTYKIEGGDTLSALAKRWNTTIDAIIAANQGNSAIKSRKIIIKGGVINIPSGAAPVQPEKKEEKTEVQKVEEQIIETKKKIDTAQSILDQAKALGYKPDQEILIDPNTNAVLPPPTDEKKEGGETKTDGTYTVPDWLANNDYFKQLTPDEQKYIVNYYNVLRLNDQENQDRLKKALNDAKAQADPYFAEQIRIAQSELLTALGEQKGDFASKQRDLQLRIDQIKEDLATGKERLSVDQQAELARQQRKYEVQLENLVESAAATGLTFSSKRAVAESRLATEQTDVVESTKREFQRRIEDLQIRASRGETEAQNLLKDYERVYGENVTKLVRTAEKELGTANLPTLPELPGVSPLGGVTGRFEEEKTKDILTRAEALANLRNPFL